MKIINHLNKKGRPFEIPGASRDDLPELFKDLGFKVGAEIGVYQGEYSEKLCRAGLRVFAIDPWIDPYEIHYSSDKNTRDNKDEEYLNAYEMTKNRLKGYNFEIIRATSMEAVKQFKDQSLDFVYIDGDHTFRYVAEDLYEWSKKVKPGGVIAGHDYFRSKGRGHSAVHVRPVVDAFTKAFKIKNYFVLGERYAKDRDKWRSYFWIQP